MGKVRSFFSVLGCPKSQRSKANGTKNDKRINKPSSNKELQEFTFNCGNTFSFSDRNNDTPVHHKPKDVPIEESDIRSEIEDSLYNQKEIALLALTNTLNLKLRYNIVVALVCLQHNANRARLYSHFIKKVYFTITRNVRSAMRDAMSTFREHHIRQIRNDTICKVTGTIEAKLEKYYKNLAVENLSTFEGLNKPEGDNKHIVEKALPSTYHEGDARPELKVQSCRNVKSRIGFNDSIGSGRSAQPRSHTTDVSCTVYNITRTPYVKQLQSPYIPLDDPNSVGREFSSSKRDTSGPTCRASSQCSRKAPLLSNREKVETHNKRLEDAVIDPEKEVLGNIIYRKAIENVSVIRPLLVTSKSNIVYELDFFTSEKYVNYANKAMRVLRDVNFTPGAIERLIFLADKYRQKSLVVSVTGGGCSGFQYHFDLIDDPGTLKCIYDKEGCLKVYSDHSSLELIDSCTIEYQRNLVGSKFVLDNIKNVSRRCSCGNSFDIKN